MTVRDTGAVHPAERPVPLEARRVELQENTDLSSVDLPEEGSAVEEVASEEVLPVPLPPSRV